jgi:arginyl-tRNA synthetase
MPQSYEFAAESQRDLLAEIELILADHGALSLCAVLEPRRREEQDADLRLLFTDRTWLQSPAGDRLIEALRRDSAVVTVLRRRSALTLRFDDGALARLEARMQANDRVSTETADLLAGHCLTIGFVGPNTNKALHVGHLRNIYLGHALASALESAGASVQRHSLVGDIGRRVCEAIAGYVVYHDGETPDQAGIPGDRFVELCSRDYVRNHCGSNPSLDLGDPNAEENEPTGDLADSVMQAWLRGEPREWKLWSCLRGWVLASHQQTLARLGVRFDYCDFESDAIQRALALIAEGLARGVLMREPAGTIVYKTGRPEYTTMVLLREDGIPTEYARLLGAYDGVLESLDPAASYIEVVGIEWHQPLLALRELLATLPESPRVDAYDCILHGSVTNGGQKMGSSTGEVLWIDDLLDQVARSSRVAALEVLSGNAVSKDELADLVVRGAFLYSPPAQPLPFSVKRLIETASGPGWTIAEAWCQAQQPCAPDDTAPRTRTAIVQSLLYRRTLRLAVERREVASLMSYLHKLSEACLAAPVPGPAAAPMLRRVLRSLGFLAGGFTPTREELALTTGSGQPELNLVGQ